MDKFLKYINKKNIALFIIALCVIVFVILMKNVFEKEIMTIDIWANSFVMEYLRSDILTNIMWVITNLGGAIFLIVLSLLAIIFIKDKKLALMVPLNLIIVTLLNNILKIIVQRDRPLYMIIEESGYSFPSGHSMVSTAFYGLLVYLVYKNVKNVVWRNVICISLCILILLICSSRIYFGVHYASDVISGIVISIAYLLMFTVIYKKIK